MKNCAVLDPGGVVVNLVVADPKRFIAPDGCDFVVIPDGAVVNQGQQFDRLSGQFLPDEAA